MKKIIFPLCFSALSLLLTPLRAQTSQHEHQLAAAREVFEQKNWNACIDQLTQLRNQIVSHQQEVQADATLWSEVQTHAQAFTGSVTLEEIDYMLAVSSFEKDKLYCLELFDAFERNYPVSTYLSAIKYLRATRYFLSGDYKKAIATYESLSIKELPDHFLPDFYQRLGVAYLHEDQPEKAYPLFVVLKDHSGKYHPSALYYLGYIAYLEGNYDQALAYFKEVEHYDFKESNIPYYLMQIAFTRGEEEAALKTALDLLSSERYTPNQEAELHRIIATVYYNQGQHERALQHFKQYFALEQEPFSSSAFTGGVCAYTAGDLALAEKAFHAMGDEEGALRQSSYVYLGHIYQQQGKMLEAQMAFEKASKMNADLTVQEEALYNYALTLHKGADNGLTTSVTVFEDFLNRFPNSRFVDQVSECLVQSYNTVSDAGIVAALHSIEKLKTPSRKILAAKQRLLFLQGTQEVLNGRLSQAIVLFDQAIALGTLDREVLAQAYFWRGECYYRNSSFAQASSDLANYFKYATRKDTQVYALALYNRAFTYFKMQELDLAIDYFKQYTALPGEQGKATYTDALNRLGDAYYYLRQFERAKQYYEMAAMTKGSSIDYSLYQQAHMAGIQKDYAQKIKLLSDLNKKYPDSSYADDALNELGLTYVLKGESDNAIEVFESLLNKYPQSPYARRSGVQLGMLYFNKGQNENAIQAYKHVIEKYPSTAEARLAVEDLKSVYVHQNNVNGYADYIKSLGGSMTFRASEQDSLTYMAAERLLQKGDYQGGVTAMNAYLAQFEKGAMREKALSELARAYVTHEQFEKAKEAYLELLAIPTVLFQEEALEQTAHIYYKAKEYAQAMKQFDALYQVAQEPSLRHTALRGVLFSAQNLTDYQKLIPAATTLLKDQSLSPDERNEILTLRSKAYLALDDLASAKKDWALLAKDLRVEAGAEAGYLLAQTAFDEGDDVAAEKLAKSFMAQGTPFPYWSARVLILQADIFAKRNENATAKLYLDNIKANYKGENDDILQLIEHRYKQLDKPSNGK